MNRCPRCQSLMLSEAMHERDTNDLQTTIYLSRCPMCGYYTDRLMEANRGIPSPTPPRDLRPSYYRIYGTEHTKWARDRELKRRYKGKILGRDYSSEL